VQWLRSPEGVGASEYAGWVWVNHARKILHMPISQVSVSWSGCNCAARKAGGQVLRCACALASHIRAMSRQLSQLAKGLATLTAQWPRGASASAYLSYFFVRFWYRLNPGRIKKRVVISEMLVWLSIFFVPANAFNWSHVTILVRAGSMPLSGQYIRPSLFDIQEGTRMYSSLLQSMNAPSKTR